MFEPVITVLHGARVEFILSVGDADPQLWCRMLLCLTFYWLGVYLFQLNKRFHESSSQHNTNLGLFQFSTLTNWKGKAEFLCWQHLQAYKLVQLLLLPEWVISNTSLSMQELLCFQLKLEGSAIPVSVSICLEQNHQESWRFLVESVWFVVQKNERVLTQVIFCSMLRSQEIRRGCCYSSNSFVLSLTVSVLTTHCVTDKLCSLFWNARWWEICEFEFWMQMGRPMQMSHKNLPLSSRILEWTIFLVSDFMGALLVVCPVSFALSLSWYPDSWMFETSDFCDSGKRHLCSREDRVEFCFKVSLRTGNYFSTKRKEARKFN